MVQSTSLIRAPFQSSDVHLAGWHHKYSFLSVDFKAVDKIASWQDLHDHLEHFVIIAPSLVMYLGSQTMLAVAYD